MGELKVRWVRTKISICLSLLAAANMVLFVLSVDGSDGGDFWA